MKNIERVFNELGEISQAAIACKMLMCNECPNFRSGEKCEKLIDSPKMRQNLIDYMNQESNED